MKRSTRFSRALNRAKAFAVRSRTLQASITSEGLVLFSSEHSEALALTCVAGNLPAVAEILGEIGFGDVGELSRLFLSGELIGVLTRK